MAAGELKVSPEKLQSTATVFEGSAKKVQGLTTQMIQTVTSLTGQVWSGDAATAYNNKFKGLEDDMQRMFNMIEEHSKDLIEMAKQYSDAEKSAMDLVNSLSSDVIS